MLFKKFLPVNYIGKKGTHAVLVSKSGFTKSAQKLARANKVKLINDFELKDLENILI